MILQQQANKINYKPIVLNGYDFIYALTVIATIIIIIRQLVPFLGETIITTSIVNSVLLGSWIYGYKTVKKNHKKPLIEAYYLQIIAIIFGFLGSYLHLNFINYCFSKFFQMFLHTSIEANGILWLFLLWNIIGLIIPIGYNLGKTKFPINNYGLLGVGGGAIITTMVLMKFFGIAINIFIVTLLWLLLANINYHRIQPKATIQSNNPPIFIWKTNKFWLLKLLYLSIFIGSLFYLNVYLEKNFFIKTNAYANYQVFSKSGSSTEKIFSVNESNSSQIDQKQQGFAYIELIKRILFQDLKLQQQKILMLGAGGFSFSASGNHHNQITYVDLDPDLPEIVNKAFNRSTQNFNYQAIDAGVFVKNVKNNLKKYHAIIVDHYSSKYIIPSHLLEKKYLFDLKSILSKDGVIIFNIIGNPALQDQHSRSIDRKIRSIFNECMVIPVNYYIHNLSNILYVCYNGSS